MPKRTPKTPKPLQEIRIDPDVALRHDPDVYDLVSHITDVDRRAGVIIIDDPFRGSKGGNSQGKVKGGVSKPGE